MVKGLMKYAIMLCCILGVVLQTACGGDDGEDSPSGGNEYLNVADINIPTGNTTATMYIKASDNCEWVITCAESWISFSETKGRGDLNVTIKVTPNPSALESRTAQINVSSPTITRVVKLTQEPNAESLVFNVSPKQLSSDALASSVQFDIVVADRWTIKSNKDWTTPDILSGENNKTITVALTDNVSTSERVAEVTVTSSSKSETVTITQAAATMPEISAVAASGVSKNEATVTFNYSSMFPVTEYGVCYSATNQNPTKADSYKLQTGSAKQGTATIQLTGLQAGTIYYIRAYAVSVVGTQYSNSLSFSTMDDWPGNDDNVPPGL